jgi:predicted nucleotidyltransferase
MTNISLNISGKIEPDLIEALRIVDREAAILGIKFFIVGAWARDIIMEHGYGIRAPRMTRDMDIGIQVATWKQFEDIRRALIETSFFREANEPHRLISDSSIIDIIPFGGITDSGKKLSWPPEHFMVMNLLGYEEAFRHATMIRLSEQPELDALVPTIPGFLLMKLISWNDRKDRDNDAQDVFFILEHYSETNDFADIYEEAGLMQEEDFDMDMSCIRLLGRWMRNLADEDTARALYEIMKTEAESSNRLIWQMLGGRKLSKERTQRAYNYLLKLKQGFEESGT